jgi:hypothetical protein
VIRELSRRQWVVAVVCLTEAFLDGYRLDISQPPVHVVKVERLIEFLESYDDTRPLTETQIRQLGDALDRLVLDRV